MALRRVRIENFRGIRKAEVNFDSTTVLIGENDSGVSDILAALALALSPDQKPGESGRIELTFFESRAGSWGRPGLEALAPILGRKADKPRKLILEINSERWTVTGSSTSGDDPEVLAAVRRINPLVWLRHGMKLVAPVDKRILEEWAPDLQGQPVRMRAMVSEILARGTGGIAAAPSTVQASRQASTAQETGVFLVAAQIVHQLRSNGSPGVRPLIVVEEPEAHLHPMTLASIWGLLELFRSTQKIVTTNSGTFLAAAPLQALRRMVRDANGVVRQFRVPPDRMRSEDLRKVSYHLRARRGIACFARVWLLVEGETEFWIMPDLARLCGYDLAQEGIVCVEFAQCGLVPLVKFANHLGIAWHVLTDGDRAGDAYVQTVKPYLNNGGSQLTRLREPDIEHCFWKHGFGPVFERLAKIRTGGKSSPTRVIKKAIESQSKPGVAFELLAAVAARGEDGPPPPLRSAIDTCVRMARGA